MVVDVFVRDTENGDFGFVQKILGAAGFEDYEIVDLKVTDPATRSTKSKAGIAFGKICGRLVKDYVDNLLWLPSIAQLKPVKKNETYRKDAWEKLKGFKKVLDSSKEVEENGGDWRYATVLIGDKKVCIYETRRPSDIEADVYISRDDSNLLMRMKEAFRADAVLIGEEAE